MMIIGIFVLSCISSIRGERELTTLRSFTLDLPFSDSVEIIEGDPLWEKRKGSSDSLNQYRKRTSTSSTANPTHSTSDDQEENSTEFSQTALRDFLDSYAEKVRLDKIEQHSADNPTIDHLEKNEKSWNLLKTNHHNHPYDDNSGWVSLDPVPWSVSKISKWHNKPMPADISWNDYPSTKRPWNDFSSHMPFQNKYKYKSPSDQNKYQVYYVNEEDLDRAQYSRPSNIHRQQVYMQVTPSMLHTPDTPSTSYQKDGNYEQVEISGIVTDGQPSNFPVKYVDTNRRFSSDPQPVTHPFMDDGEWVLLSTSKGYKFPKKQRSLKLNPGSIGTHKSVHITVLPPLKGSKINMTTSHGGLLQVESTFETVEQAQKKLQKRTHQMKKRKRPGKLVKRKRKVSASNNVLESTVATVPRSTGTTENDSSAILAGVGAGLIPATMAMFVPIAMNRGKKRRRRDTLTIPSVHI
ncbi:unnamed protein product [Phaedon cochleariae]|uniref:Uncharacterized protein n=1 Tax=Phaedon cochleariae TaxID=80249 RepID=A0A9N9SHT1_PHACE|nr:unnamed protein product [Phaedon cochleariae]